MFLTRLVMLLVLTFRVENVRVGKKIIFLSKIRLGNIIQKPKSSQYKISSIIRLETLT